MRNIIKAAIYVTASLLLFFLLRDFFPKYAGPMKAYLVLWVLDGYLWFPTASCLRKKGRAVYFSAGLLYWTPFLLIIGGIIYGWFFPFLDWNILFKTEFLNFIQTGYAIKVLPITARLLHDGSILVFGQRHREGAYGIKTPKRRNWFMITGWGLGLILGFALVAGHILWQYRFRVEKVDLTIKDLPASFDRIRIVQISDLHLGNWICRHRLDDLAGRVNNLKPDVIFVTGDMATFSSSDVSSFRANLKKFSAHEGIFVIYGNHDYGQYYKVHNQQEVYDNMARFARIYKELGWTLLCNEQRVLTRGTDSIAILGVENWGAEARFPKLADIVRAEKGTENIATKLLLSHDPTYWEQFIIIRHPEVDVTFSGHTHGGQIGVESKSLRFSLVSPLHPYWAGLYADTTAAGDIRYLYVNRGAGTVGYFGRIGILPEITLFVLHCGPG